MGKIIDGVRVKIGGVKTIHDLRTPAFLIDLEKFTANCQMALQTAERLGVRLRPHVKTHKTLEGARLQVGDTSGPITVSTLAEAEFFGDAGFGDITYAVPPHPGKLGAILNLMERVERLNLVIDNLEVVEPMEQAARARGRQFDVFLKIDSGNHRVGVDPASKAAFATVWLMVRSPALRFRGLLTHAGHAYGSSDPEVTRRVARQEGECMVQLAERLRREGISCDEVSVGSTPTLVQAPEVMPGVTEMRPGNYVLFDQMQVNLRNCGESNVAGTVLAGVIGVYPGENRFVVDAGALALSKDPGVPSADGRSDYGRVLGRPELKVVGLSQEHGIVGSDEQIDFSDIKIGSLVRIVPNHSCLAAALFPVYQVVEGEKLIEEWKPIRGW